MWPPIRNGSIASSSSARPQRKPIPLGPHILWPETATKSRPERLHVDTDVRRRLSRVADMDRAALVRPGGERRDVVDRPERVGDEVRGDDLDVPEAVELVEPQLTPVVDRDQPEVGACPLRDVLPGNEVRVVLELGREDDVAGAEVRQAPRVRDEVDRLGRVADEDDLALRRRVDERASLLARALEGGGRTLAELVDAAVHVRVRRLVEVGHRVQHLTRLLRARGRVEEGERLAVDQLLEDREIGAQPARVECRTGGYSHCPTVSGRSPATVAAR